MCHVCFIHSAGGGHLSWFCMHGQSLQSCLTLCDAMDCSLPGFSACGILRQEQWSGLPCPSPGHLPNPGIKHASLMSPALAGGFFTTIATLVLHFGYYQ